MEKSNEFLKTLKTLQAGIIRLKSNPLFNTINFSSIEDKESISLRMFDCPVWFYWATNNIVDILGVKVTLNESVANRLLKYNLSLSVKYPEIIKDGKKIHISIYCYMYLNKPVYKYIYVTDNLSFSQSNLSYSELIHSVKAIMDNKPITKKVQITGFMNRLNSLSPNFGKSIDEY